MILDDTNNVLHFSVTKFLCTLWSLALAKKSSNNINNNRAQVSRLCYFFWLCSNISAIDVISEMAIPFQNVVRIFSIYEQKGLDPNVERDTWQTDKKINNIKAKLYKYTLHRWTKANNLKCCFGITIMCKLFFMCFKTLLQIRFA